MDVCEKQPRHVLESVSVVMDNVITSTNLNKKKRITASMKKDLEYRFVKGWLKKSKVDYRYVKTIAEWELLLKELRNDFLPDFGPIQYRTSMSSVEFQTELDYSID